MSSDLLVTGLIALALDKLEHLEPDKYIIAVGPGNEAFIAAPSGYKATYIPPTVLGELSAGLVKKITWVSFGCRSDSFFFRYELHDGTSTYRLGPNTSPPLQGFIQGLGKSEVLASGLRVQFGADDSFVAWSNAFWTCRGVPPELEFKLRQISLNSSTVNGIAIGGLRDGTLDNVQWHSNGSFYLKNSNRHLWKFAAHSVDFVWNEMWKALRLHDQTRSFVEELAYVTIGPYSEKGESFAFIKKKLSCERPPYILHFEGGPTYHNFTPGQVPTTCDPPSVFAPGSSSGDAAPSFRQDQPTIAKLETPPFRWAVSKKSGRPHRNDTWELELEKDERIKVIRDMGREWYLATNARAATGWVHGSWIKFVDDKVHRDTKLGYTRFMEDLQKLLVPGELQEFPVMRSYVDECTRPECKAQKQDASSLGICIHDLLVLLEGSGRVSYEWLREGRNLWHPDRFTRFCRAEHAERLRPLAEQMFVMYGILMEQYRR